MRIAILTLLSRSDYGGVERFNSLLLDQLVRHGHDVHIIGFDSIPLSGADRLLLAAASKTPYRDALKARIMARHVNPQGFDCVIASDAFGMHSDAPKRIAVMHAYYGQVFESVRPRISPFYYPWGQELARVQDWAMKKADAVVVPSDWTRDYLAKKKPRSRNIRTILHGIDTDFFKPVADPRKRLAAFGLPDDYLLFVGSNAPWKNVETIQRLSEKNPLVAITDAKTAPPLRRVESHQMELLPSFYSGARLLVHPAFAEGFGYAVAEALSCETPVVTTDTGLGYHLKAEFPEMVVDDPTDTTQLQRKIDFLSANRSEFAKRSRQYIERTCDLQKWGNAWNALVES